MADHSAAGAAGFLFEMGVLKRVARTGWWFTNVTHPESVAEHSHRTAIIATMLAVAEGADPARASVMATFHDTQETRVGDIAHIGRRYLTQTTSNSEITTDQVSACPPAVGAYIQQIIDEYEAQETPEARVAKDADKLECLVQALEYAEHGHNTRAWVHTPFSALKTDTARAWAQAALDTSPQQWLSTFHPGCPPSP